MIMMPYCWAGHPWRQPLTRRCQQQRELGIGMRGPHVPDPRNPADRGA
jgi:hypothetical protein